MQVGPEILATQQTSFDRIACAVIHPAPQQTTSLRMRKPARFVQSCLESQVLMPRIHMF